MWKRRFRKKIGLKMIFFFPPFEWPRARVPEGAAGSGELGVCVKEFGEDQTKFICKGQITKSGTF